MLSAYSAWSFVDLAFLLGISRSASRPMRIYRPRCCIPKAHGTRHVLTCFYFATQLLGVFERESFVCRAGSLAPHLFVLVFCLGVQCTPS